MSMTKVRPGLRVADVVIAASLWGLVDGMKMKPPQAIGLASAAWALKMLWEAEERNQ